MPRVSEGVLLQLRSADTVSAGCVNKYVDTEAIDDYVPTRFDQQLRSTLVCVSALHTARLHIKIYAFTLCAGWQSVCCLLLWIRLWAALVCVP
jgi:hypothetical protein